MMARALAVWLLLLIAAILNGGLRETLIIPRTTEAAGHAISTITLCAAILLLTWLTVGWMGPATARDAWTIGAMWVALTLAFEFLAGHYLFGNSWPRLLADYDILRGRIWILVLMTTAIAPWVVAQTSGLLRRPA